MAFTFTVEDGTGITGANSYVSVAEADDYYVVDTNFAATWADLDTSEKEARLAWASRVLDQKVVWAGVKAVETSGLRWPRQGAIDRDGVEIEDNIVPVQVKQAALEMLKVLTSSDLTAGQNIDYLKELRVDVIELIWQDRQGQSNIPNIINELLRGIGWIEVGGPRFARIAKA